MAIMIAVIMGEMVHNNCSEDDVIGTVAQSDDDVNAFTMTITKIAI